MGHLKERWVSTILAEEKWSYRQVFRSRKDGLYDTLCRRGYMIFFFLSKLHCQKLSQDSSSRNPLIITSYDCYRNTSRVGQKFSKLEISAKLFEFFVLSFYLLLKNSF